MLPLVRTRFPSADSPAAAADWRNFSLAFFVGATLVLLGLLLLSIVLDPYDTGRFSPLPPRPRSAISPRFDYASRGRDPMFDSVIVGNSHVAPISPTRLSRASNGHFAALIVAGGSPKSTIATLRWFLAHRTAPVRTVIVGADDAWCLDRLITGHEPPFPFWLVSLRTHEYVFGSLRLGALEQAFDRLFFPSRRHVRPRPPDGFWDLELDIRWERDRVERALAVRPWAPISASGRYPGLDELRVALSESPWVSSDTTIILLRPPVWAGAIPEPDTREADLNAKCKAGMAQFANQHTGITLLDWRTDRSENRVPENFFDATHYRAPIAVKVEEEIVRVLRGRRDQQSP
jgi:hypothetical protein